MRQLVWIPSSQVLIMLECAWSPLTTLKCDGIESPPWSTFPPPTFILLPTYMTDWESPAVILSEYYIYVHIVHVLFGLYIWEIILNLDFDYAILARKREFRSSFLLYLGARWFPLVTIILEMVGLDEHYLDCQSYIVFAYLFTYLGFLFASSLIVLRIVAIWERNKIVITIASGTWLANLGTCIHSVATIRTIWIAPLQICGISDVLKARYSIISIISTEIVLLALMLYGLLRWRSRGKGGLLQLLCTQGLAWVVVTFVAEIPPLVLILLNLNEMMDVMTHLSALCIVSIAATRMYRELSDYLGRTNVFYSTHVTPSPGAGRSNSTPFGRLIAPPGTGNTSSFGNMQGGSQSFVLVIGSPTVAPSNDAGEEEAPSVGDVNV